MNRGSHQTTLFQTWASSLSQKQDAQAEIKTKKPADRQKTRSKCSEGTEGASAHSLWTDVDYRHAIDDPDEQDDQLLVAACEEKESLASDCAPCFPPPGNSDQSPSPSGELTLPDFPGCHNSSAEVWIYPTNYPIRDYQLQISEAALVQNTLVCLPTGMGKTFIASVVMYNFYRWYPFGKIVFMAPTRPLVAQQIEACYKVMGIPQSHMAELTGNTAARHRQEVWRTKRVFFLTPQVMVNDLSRNSCPACQVKCVVIDEAHKALGNHAYCQVIRQLGSQTQQFRVLALSATPGGDVKSVQAVISNLLISHIELRSDESPDIQAHSHQRSVDKVVVPLGEMLLGHQERYLELLEKFMSRLVQNRVMAHKDLRSLTKYQLILARDQFRKNPPSHIRCVQQGMLEGDFALCISLYHGYELLIQMGLRSLFSYIQGIMDGSREMSRAKNELQRTPLFMNFYHDLEAMFMKPSLDGDESFIYSHPKLKKLEEVVLQHFRTWEDTDGADGRNKHTRVMIFSSFRESVQEIAAMLNRHTPLIRVMAFMGQASAGRGVKGFTQKEQLEVVHSFRQGGFNTLVSTCVGEEGLDIGEVDLIVCFDAQKNPTRLVQRMGRTGRKRQGHIVVILAEGREERTYNQSQNNKLSVYKSITGNKNKFHMHPNSPRMLPHGVYPKLHKMHITCGQFDPRECSRRSVRGRGSRSDRVSLPVHPQNQNSDGFLSSSEYSEWLLSMSLQDGDAPPFLRLSTFLSICSEPPHQEASSGRELSLWEWRHWQHKVLPFHALDHSLRCQHFVQIMQLINSMREEGEEDCFYEQELLPYLHQRDAVKNDHKKIKTIKNSLKINELEQSHLFAFESLEKQAETSLAAGFVSPLTKKTHSTTQNEEPFIMSGREKTPADVPLVPEASPLFPSIQHCPSLHLKNKCATQTKLEVTDEDVDLEAMFCPRKWVSTPSYPVKLFSRQSEGLKTIFNNVAKLLSQSPPSLPDELDAAPATCPLPPPTPQRPAEVFPISFNLDEDDEDMKDDESTRSPVGNKAIDTWTDILLQENPAVRTAAGSPKWEDIFEDEEPNSMRDSQNEKENLAEIALVSNGCKHLEAEEDPQSAAAVKRVVVDMEESLDLFDDDEPLLQMTFPDVCTPVGADPSRRSLHDQTTADWMSHATNICSTTSARKKHRLQSEPHRKSSHLSTETRLHSSKQDSCKLNLTGSTKQEDAPPSLDSSYKVFAVNFDLGYTLEDSEEETGPLSSSSKELNVSGMSKPKTFKSSTPCSRQSSSVLVTQSKRATLPVLSEHSMFPSPITSHRERWTLTEPTQCRGETEPTEGSCLQLKSVCFRQTPQVTSDSEDEGVFQKRRPLRRLNPLSSPQLSKLPAEVDSPVVLNRKRSAVLHTSEETESGDISEEDFQRESVISRRSTTQRAKRQRLKPIKVKLGAGGHHFIDDEAELNEDEDGADVSSDEEDGEEQNRNLQDFVVDSTRVSEGLDESQMQEVYLKSVRSPAGVRGKFKMFFTERPSLNVFSQVPELDETYTEDSFVVGSDVEEVASSEDEVARVELLPEESSVDGRKIYVTRRRLLLHKTRNQCHPNQRGTNKHTRLLHIHDSSEEETRGGPEGEQREGSGKAPDEDPRGADPSTLHESASSCSRQAEARRHSEEDQHQTRFCQKFKNQHVLSDQLNFVEPEAQIQSRKDHQDLHCSSPICILVDSRCLGAGGDLLTFLRQQHAATVHVCSLDGGYFIVSCRMAVERLSRTELATGQNQRRLAERVSYMLGLFERVCLIVEKERCPAGDTTRPFQRTRHYDSTLAALVRSGVRLLWSSGVEESAALLADLARLEQRKGWGITSPLKVRGQQGQQTLQWCSSLPSIHYAHALQLSQHFRSIIQLVNSSVDILQAGGCMSRSRAERLLVFLRYSVDFLVLSRTTSGT